MLRRYFARVEIPSNFTLFRPTTSLAPSISTGAAFFSAAPSPKMLEVLPYVPGQSINYSYIRWRAPSIAKAKLTLENYLYKERSQDKDLAAFVDILFDFTSTSKFIRKIDIETQKIISSHHPRLIAHYQHLQGKKDNAKLELYLKDQFLPSLRDILQRLARHYELNPVLLETCDGLLHDDDFMDFIAEGRLVLDLGEDGHGPLPHVIAAFMMKEAEKEGLISSAEKLYKSLAQRSHNFYCPYRVNFVYRFLLVLDASPELNLGVDLFNNPASLSNHLLTYGDSLKDLAVICKRQSRSLMQIAMEDWKQRPDEFNLVRGKAKLS